MDLFADDDVPATNVSANGQRVKGGDDFAITINEGYASRFQHNHERAELHRLQEKYGPAAAGILAGKRGGNDDGADDSQDEDDDSEDETEDEEGEQVTAEVDAAILRTLARIRSGDQSIYDSEKNIFDEEQAHATGYSGLPASVRTKNGKKVTLADYQRSRLKDLMATSSDPALALADATTFTTRDDAFYGGQSSDPSASQPLSHVQEQANLRQQVTQAFHAMGDDEGDEAADNDFFTKSKSGLAGEDDEDEQTAYKKYLLSSLGDDEARKSIRKALRTDQPQSSSARDQAGWNATTRPARDAAGSAQSGKPKKSEEQLNEDFLMNYVLNRGWMENPNAAPKLSSRRRIEPDAADERAKVPQADAAMVDGERDWDAEAAELESEASFDSRADAFEQAFNFRYEAMEAGEAPAQVQSYARNTQNSVRRVEDKRKIEREERKKRKELEKRQRIEEIDRLRELKRSQLREKLKQLQEAAGAGKIDFDPLQLEGDFDDEQHNAMMAVFDDAYYDEKDGEDEDGKPTWDDDIDIEDILAEEKKEDEADLAAASKKAKKDKKKKKAKKGDAATGDDDAIEMDADFPDGEEDVGAVDMSQLSKKDRKKLKKKLKSQGNKDGADVGGVDVAAMDADAEGQDSVPETAEERKAAAKKIADEYRSLEFEDVIGGDLATRFHYTQVPKSSYGLNPVEILLADDKDLNEVVALKNFQPYRRGGDKRPRDLNRRVKELRRKLEDEAEGDDSRKKSKKRAAGGADDGREVKKTKRLGKKERKKAAAAAAAEDPAVDGSSVSAAQPHASEKASTGATSADDAGTKSLPAAGPAADDEEEKLRRRKEKKDRKRAERKAAALA
ncbi:unnamed protein product [Parajaminaea phylloscopi]